MPLRECVRGVYSEVSAGKHKARCILVASAIIAPFEISLTARERATYRSLDARKSKRKWVTCKYCHVICAAFFYMYIVTRL